MKKIEFKGHSDDTFGWYPVGDEARGEDHDDCARLLLRVYHIHAGDQRMAVTGIYGHECMWSVGIAPIEDDDVMPDWPMEWKFEGYTTVLVIDLPEDVKISLVEPKPGKDDD